MWLSLKVENQSKIGIVNRQTMRPAWGTGNQILTITTKVALKETVLGATDRAIRLRYEIIDFDTQSVGPGKIELPSAWAAPKEITKASVDITLIPTATVINLGNSDMLPPETLKRLQSLGEDIRSCWILPPNDCNVGDIWTRSHSPSKDSLDRGVKQIQSHYRMADMQKEMATIAADFEFEISTDTPKRRALGSQMIYLSRNVGVVKVSRLTKIVSQNQGHSKELQRSDLLLQRLG